MKIESVHVFMLVRVTDDSTDAQMESVDGILEDRENGSVEDDLLYQAAEAHMSAVEKELKGKLDFQDYDISREIIVKRKSEK